MWLWKHGLRKPVQPSRQRRLAPVWWAFAPVRWPHGLMQSPARGSVACATDTRIESRPRRWASARYRKVMIHDTEWARASVERHRVSLCRLVQVLTLRLDDVRVVCTACGAVGRF